MNCPRDGAALQATSVQDTPIERCPTCGGMFLRHGQLNRIVHPEHGDIEFSTVDRETFQHEDDHGLITCPNDQSTMQKVDFNVETSIILDYCPSCEGFWLDGEELERIRDEVKRLDEAGDEVPDPLLVRISKFFWNLPVPH